MAYRRGWRAMIEDWHSAIGPHMVDSASPPTVLPAITEQQAIAEARSMLGTADVAGITGLRQVAGHVRTGTLRMDRCRAAAGDEIAAMRAAGAGWETLSFHLSATRSFLERCVALSTAQATRTAADADALGDAELLARVVAGKANPIQRYTEVMAFYDTLDAIYLVLDDLRTTLYVELLDDGHTIADLVAAGGQGRQTVTRAIDDRRWRRRGPEYVFTPQPSDNVIRLRPTQ